MASIVRPLHMTSVQNVNHLRLIRAYKEPDGSFCTDRPALNDRRWHNFDPVRCACPPCPKIAVATHEIHRISVAARSLQDTQSRFWQRWPLQEDVRTLA